MTGTYLKFKQANCSNCYRCIRHCPVKAISFSEHQARILDDECLLCGRCFVACPQSAKEVRNDLAVARQLLDGEAPVYASLAPSFVARFGGVGIEAMAAALGTLGFAGAEETALGAQMVKNRYDELVRAGEQRVIISSCCHSVTLLIQKHYPEALPFLARVVSPMQAHARDIRRRHPGSKVIFIGPCISKKAEAETFPDNADCVLTFDELADWLAENAVAVTARPDDRAPGKSRLFPTSGGIVRSMRRDNPDYAYLSIDGVENCINALKDILRGDLDRCFVEMSACTGSCLGGPAMGEAARSPLRGSIALSRYAGREDFPLEAEAEAADKAFAAARLRRGGVSEKAVLEVLRKIGKTRPEDELNCGSCGYDTCREKAAAVILGKAELSMCLPFLKEKAESFSDSIITHSPNGIVVLNESLVLQQINRAACRMLNLESAGDALGNTVSSLLDPDIFLEVKDSRENVYERFAYLAEYQRSVRQTVVFDASNRVFILIMRDVTEAEAARERNEAISRKAATVADQVIEKQMRVVQEIASLLGETTAETKVALTRLKESLHLDE